MRRDASSASVRFDASAPRTLAVTNHAVPVLSIDLAYRRHKDIGVAVLQQRAEHVEVRFLDVSRSGEPKPDDLAEFFVSLAQDVSASLLLIDGPQGWKGPENGLQHSRLCERMLNTPAKTGLPSVVKPANYGPFVEFSIAFFDHLHKRGWPRFDNGSAVRGVAVETFPLAAWRSLGLSALPAKSKTSPSVLMNRRDALLSVFPTLLESEPNHDQLQALVSGYAGLAMNRGANSEYVLAGEAPYVFDGFAREGFIANPLRRP